MSDASGKQRFAYVFYATNDEYAVAALVVVRQLKQLRVREDADFVVLYLSLPAPVLSKMHEMGIVTKRVEPLPYIRHKYYRHCLLKLRVFELVEYERIVFLDADTIPLQDLDHLFSLEFSEQVAAPDAYWLDDLDVTTVLLLVKPSLELWKRIQKRFSSAAENNYFDMDIVNVEFKNEIYMLPAEYSCLNSEWEDLDRPFYFGDPEKSFQRIKVVHFTAIGKPWSYRPGTVRRLRPNAHPVFHLLWDRWWAMRNEILPENARQKAARLAAETRALIEMRRRLWVACLRGFDTASRSAEGDRSDRRDGEDV